MKNFEYDVIGGLMTDVEYARKIIPHITSDHFRDDSARLLFGKCKDYITTYAVLPTVNVLQVEVTRMNGKVSDELIKKSLTSLEGITGEIRNHDWLLTRTEEFGKEAEFYNAASKTMGIVSGDDKKTSKEQIPELFRKALSFAFDSRVGYDYFEEAASRWDFYNTVEERIEFDIGEFNDMTGGGLPKKTLICPMAGTNVGKSALLTCFTGGWAQRGKNVLYVSGEMMRERVAERVDAFMLQIPIRQLKETPKDFFTGRLAQAARDASSRIIIEEFATGQGDINKVRRLLDDLWIKKRFEPDIIVGDYMRVFKPTTVGRDSGMYERGMAMAEEWRGLAVERNLPCIVPVQLNRGGQGSSDPEFDDLAESHGISMTADLMFAMIRTDQMREEGRVMIKQIKSRFDNVDRLRKFVVGFDPDRMTFFGGVNQAFAGPQAKNRQPVDDSSSWAEVQSKLAEEGSLF